MSEQWRPVLGWEGMYEVSDQGGVRSLDRTINSKKGRWGPATQQWRGRVLSPTPSGTGHVQVNLTNAGKVWKAGVHVLVAEAFLGLRPEGHWVLHRNDAGDDNRMENLYWGTRSQNQHDAVRNGRNKNANKIICPRGHLLDGANLVAAELKNGKRKCRACQLAYGTFSNAVRRHGAASPTPGVVQAEADRRYAAIMA